MKLKSNNLINLLLYGIFSSLITVPTIAFAKSDVFCAIEVGSKGVKARMYSLSEDKNGYLEVDTRYKENVNTTIVASIKDGDFSDEAISETADAVKSEIANMRKIDDSCTAFVVGSSGVAKANNKQLLADKVKELTSLPMEFISPDDEAIFGFIASVPAKYRKDSLLVDLGSGNTKIAFANNGKIETKEVPFGTVSLTKELQEKHDVDFDSKFLGKVKQVVLPPLKELKKSNPEIAKKKRIYWIGGAAWATTTYTYPEFSENTAVRIYTRDMNKFFSNLKKNRWMDTHPPKKTSKAALKIHKKHWSKVKDIFRRENLLSALSMMSLIVKETNPKGRINFLRNGQWLYGYTRQQFMSDKAEPEEQPKAKRSTTKVVHTPSKGSKSNIYCAIEIGSKGVKARVYALSEDKEGYLDVDTKYKEEVNTTIIASIQGGNFSDEAIEETAEAVSSELKKMREVEPSCTAFAVGSSGAAKAKNKQLLADKIMEMTDIPMEFISPDDEAIYGFFASVPVKYREDSLLVDLGSGNTKIAFVQDGKVETLEVEFGTVSLTKELQEKHNANFDTKDYQQKIKDVLLIRIRELAAKKPRLVNHKRLYWIGGAAWATTTYTYPEFSEKLAVRIYRRDIQRLIRNLEKNQWMDTHPPKKTSKAALKIHKKHWGKVKSIFTRENLMSALTMFELIAKEGNPKSRINFLRNGQWLYGYTREKFNAS